MLETIIFTVHMQFHFSINEAHHLKKDVKFTINRMRLVATRHGVSRRHELHSDSRKLKNDYSFQRFGLTRIFYICMV